MSVEPLTVVKSNKLIDAKFKTPKLTKAHGRILAHLVSKVHSRKDKGFQYVEMMPVEYRKLIGNTSYTIEQIRWDLDDLTDLKCVIQNENKVIFCHLIDYAEIDLNSGMVKLRLGEEMKPYLLDLQRDYTLYYLGEFLSLKSKHSQRLYELFQKERNQKDSVIMEYKLDDLKEMLGLVEYKKKGTEINLRYPQWRDFEKRVLNKAREELCDVGIFFEYEPVTERRKTVGVKLYFDPTADSLDEQTFEDFKLLKAIPLKKVRTIYKMDISRCQPRPKIVASLAKCAEEGNYKNLISLAPKSRTERIKLFKKKARNETARLKLKQGRQKQLDL